MGLLWQKKEKKSASEKCSWAPQGWKCLPIGPSAGPQVPWGACFKTSVPFRPVSCNTKRDPGPLGDGKVGVRGSGAHVAEK